MSKLLAYDPVRAAKAQKAKELEYAKSRVPIMRSNDVVSNDQLASFSLSVLIGLRDRAQAQIDKRMVQGIQARSRKQKGTKS